MTLLYSAFVFVFGVVFVIILNLAVIQTVYDNPPYDILEEEDGYEVIDFGHRRPGDPRFILRDKVVKDLFVKLNSARLESEEENLEHIRELSVQALVPYTFISFVLGYFLANRMLKPIDNVVDFANKVKDSQEKKLISHNGENDEIGRLVMTLNSMLTRLYDSFELQKQFVEDASHEIKTPLTMISTYIDVLQDKFDKGVDVSEKEINDTLSLVNQFVGRLDVLTEDLLLLSQKKELKKSRVDLDALVKDIVEEKNVYADEKSIDLIHSALSKKAYIEAHSALLSRAITNLIDNAIKYTDSGFVFVEVFQKNHKYHLSIKDEGIGISEADVEYIFDRFYRVDKSRSRASGGFGLGLSIVKKILDEHGFNIRVESSLGKGTEFIITF